MKVAKLFLLILAFNLNVVPVFSMWKDWSDSLTCLVKQQINLFFGNYENLQSELMCPDDNGDPVLHADIRRGDRASVKRILKGVYNTLGSRVVDKLLRQVNRVGDAPLQVALDCRQTEIEQLIREYMHSDGD